MFAAIRVLRPKEWAKNSFCLAPLIFSQRAFELDAVTEASILFIAFSFLASAVYILNDIIDRDRDRAHPVKKNRPLASGALSVPVAIVEAFVVGLGALWLGAHQSMTVVVVFCIYLVLNIGYTFWLKHLVLVDLFVIAIGFVLRVMAGAAAIGVAPSQWILTCTLFISLLIAACKRRSEVVLQGSEAGTRKVLSSYSLKYLDLVIAVVAGGTILSYALYTLSPQTVEHLGTADLIYTLPFVIFAILRYVYLVLERARGESPFELLMRDAPMLIDIVGYVVVTILFVYVLERGGTLE